EHGALPHGPRAISGGGGLHVWLRVPPSLALPGRLAPGIDVIGPGRFVVAPPSRHPEGRQYAWLVGPAAPVPEAPDWLLALLEAATSADHLASARYSNPRARNGAGPAEPIRDA